MYTQFWSIIVLAVIFLVGVAGFVWQLGNMRGANARGRRKRVEKVISGTRRSDRSKLSRHERKLYDQAEKLMQHGKIQPAAQILEQIGMPREAISALENSGLIHDAAKILMRMQRHNRAGVVYARHGMWEHGAKCFKMANMPLEVAKCYREAGDFAQAEEYFEKAGRLEDAADCCIQLNDLQRAGQLFIAAGQREKAINAYLKLIESQYNPTNMEFNDDEIRLMVDSVRNGDNLETRIPEILAVRNKLLDPINYLSKIGNPQIAANLLNRAGSDIGPALMAEVNYQDGSSEKLAAVFLIAKNPMYAGMIYERMESYEAAGDAFEAAEEFERAAYCFERASKDKKAKKARDRVLLEPKRKTYSPSPFALNQLPSEGTGSNIGFNDSSNESTAMIEVPANQPPTASVAENSHPKMPPMFSTAALNELDPKVAKEPVAIVVEEKHTGLGNFRLDIEDENVSDDNVYTPKPPSFAPLDPPSKPLSKDSQALREVFNRSGFMQDLDNDQKQKLWNIGRTITYGKEETIITYNDEPGGIYIILTGNVNCYKQQGTKETYLDEMGEAESFGELWLLAEHPTAVKFVAKANTTVHIIERAGFTELLDKDGAVARKLYKRFTHRLLRRLLKPTIPQSNQKAS